MAERLYALAVEFAGLGGFERVYDLYCGIGTIGLLMAPRAAELWGLEIVERAIADAIDNAAHQRDRQRAFLCRRHEARAARARRARRRPDVVVLDPPRAGFSQKVVRRVIEARPRRIVYVSCNPTTLAPNAAQLVEAGYELRRVRPVDMFPQTPHIEASRCSNAPPIRAASKVLGRASGHYPRSTDPHRGASGPGARCGRGPRARARGGPERRRHAPAPRALPGAARLPQDIPGLELAGEVVGLGRARCASTRATA